MWLIFTFYTFRFIIFQMEKSAKYISDAKVTKENVEKFVDDFFAGKLVKSLKSESVPDDWDKEPVKVSLIVVNRLSFPDFFNQKKFIKVHHSF